MNRRELGNRVCEYLAWVRGLAAGLLAGLAPLGLCSLWVEAGCVWGQTPASAPGTGAQTKVESRRVSRLARALDGQRLARVESSRRPGLGLGNAALSRPSAPVPGRYRYTIQTATGPRAYVLHAPASIPVSGLYPVVVALHGAGHRPETLLDEMGWGAQADQGRFLVLAPEGVPIRPNLPAAPVANPRVWNTGEYDDSRARSQIDDVAFIIAALDDLAARCPVDEKRVYATGYSNGGAMAFRLGAERADRFTAIASVAGLCWVGDPRPSRSLPTLVVYGTLDPIVPLKGGVKILPWEVHGSPSVRTVLGRWAEAIGCPNSPTAVGDSPAPGVKVEDYGPGSSGSVLRVMYVKNQGHNWPGGRGLRPERMLGPDVSSLNATAAVWNFFQQWAW